MTAAMGIGAVVAGLAVAGSGRTGLRAIIIAAAAFGFAILLAGIGAHPAARAGRAAPSAAVASRSSPSATRPSS